MLQVATVSTIMLIIHDTAIAMLIVWVGRVVLVFPEFSLNASNRSGLMNWIGSKRLVVICVVYDVSVASHALTL